MPQTVVLVGTRKGLFVLESEDRRDWSMRGPYCEGWPVYHAIYDPDSGTIYAAAASEWHGAAVWRSRDLGETWEHSSEGLAYESGDLKLSKISGLTAAHGRVLAGVEAPGIFESRDGGETWSLLSRLEGQPGSEGWDDPRNQPPGHLGLAGHASGSVRPGPLLGDRAGDRDLRDVRRRRIVDAAQPGPAGRLAARARGGRLLRPQARHVAERPAAPLPAEPLRDAPKRRRRRSRGPRSPRASRPTSASRPQRTRTTATRSTSSRSIPATRASCRTGGWPCGARATPARAGSGWTRDCLSATRTSASCAREWRSTRTTSRGSTSARARARSSRAPTRGTRGRRSRPTSRPSPRSRWRWSE